MVKYMADPSTIQTKKNADRTEAHSEDAFAINEEGVKYCDIDEYDKAIEKFEEAARLDPDNWIYPTNIGDTYSKMDQLEQAISYFEAALDIAPPNINGPLFSLGQAHYLRGEYEKASAMLKEAIRIQPSAATYFGLADSLSAMHIWPEAIDYYKEALVFENSDILYNRLGVAYHVVGEDKKAIEQYEKALLANDKEFIYHSNLALSHQQLQHWDAAISSYIKALALNPDDDLCFANLGDVYSSRGEWQEAIDNYNKAIDLNSGDDKVHNGLGIAFQEIGQYVKAEKSFKKAIKLAPEDHIYYVNLGGIQVAQEKWRNATTSYRKALKMVSDVDDDPMLPELHNYIGVCLYHQGMYKKSIDSYKKATLYNPKEFIYLANLGDSYSAVGDLTLALENYLQASKITPKDDVVSASIAGVYSDQFKYSKAIEQYKYAAKLTKDNKATYWLQISNIYRIINKFDDAISATKKAINASKESDSPSDLYSEHLGLVYNDHGVDQAIKGNWNAAVKNYKKALKYNDTEPIFYKNLYTVYRDRGLDKDAHEILTKLIRLDPDSKEHQNELTTLKNDMNKAT